MIRSMLAAVSGMRSHQAYLDVIGNNIANVNTTGFKASRVMFADALSQLARGARAPEADRSGSNPVQVGLGMQVSGVETMMAQGNFQATSKITDMAIDGDGFFVLSDGVQDLFTRDGTFDVGLDGLLVSPSTGMRVLGWAVGANGQVDTTQPMTDITIPAGEVVAGQASTSINARGNLDATNYGYGEVTPSNRSSGAGAASGIYTGTANYNYSVKISAINAATGEVTGIQVSTDGGSTYGATIAASAGAAADIGNGLRFAIATNAGNSVGNTYSFTADPPVTETSVGVYDSLGILHTVKLTFRKTTTDTWSWTPSTSESGVTVAPTVPQNFTFSSAGKYMGQTPAGAVTLTLTNGAASPMSVDIDLSGVSQVSGRAEIQATGNGRAAGMLTSFTVGQAGEVTGVYSNGLNRQIGQIALARFTNPAGLSKMGQNLFDVSPNSGEPNIGTPGTGGRGEISSGFLEMSNVDLAQQFTNMIMAERGFQANSRIITTLAEVLQDLVNIQR